MGRKGNSYFTFSYQDVVQTDGYPGYDFIDHTPEKEHVGCWAHARRNE
ncbi:MAG: transposase [Desulfobacterales bacterium]|jgi:transposase|nr:transposase [Candidatus Latescibacterota bacterium]MBT7697578.1 transposase [Desulfobacterales bacterium]